MLSQRLIEEKSLDSREVSVIRFKLSWLTILTILKVVNFPTNKRGISLKRIRLVLRRVRLLELTTL